MSSHTNKSNPTSIKVISDHKAYFQSMLPMFWGISLGWIMVFGSIICSYLAVQHNKHFAFIFLLSGLCFASFLIFISYRLIRENFCDYIFEINDQDAQFKKIDRFEKKQTNQLVLLRDIKYVEYYPYLDSASIIFHTPYGEIDVPLWPMGKHAQDVIDFLIGAGVKVVDVQSDEPIPE